MQGKDSAVKGSVPAPKPTKYRLACDSCQHSKIRCDQERPKCRRCAKKGMECVYSPARRAGRPRTRNSSKSTCSVESSAPTNLKGYLTPMTEHNIAIPASSGHTSPFGPPTMLSASETSSSSSSSSNASTIPTMAQTIPLPNPDDVDFSSYRQTDDDFLQGLPDATGSKCGTPKQTTNCYYDMSPEFHIAPEFLNIASCGAPWEQQQYDPEQHHSLSPMLFDEGLPYFGLLTPNSHQPRHLDRHQADMPIPTTSSNDVESCSYMLHSQQQQVQPQCAQPFDHTLASTKTCNCVFNLLDYLSTPFHGPSSSPLTSISAALSSSRTLITSCCTTMACPNACSTRPSTALVICEAIDQALVSLRLGGTSLWTPTLAPIPSHDNRTSSSPSSLSSTSDGNSNDIMLASSSIVDEECEPLRCGTLPIQGADRRAVVRVLLVKRVLEAQQVLERLRDALLSGLLVGGDVAAKNPLLALCADVVGEFTNKVAERAETVKLNM